MLASDPSNLPRVSRDDFVRFGNGWRIDTAPGKKLTDHAITKRMKEGYYGRTMQAAALAKTSTNKKGFVDRCKCGETKGVKWYEYKYLEAPAFLCLKCLEYARGFRVKIKSAGMAARNLEEFI